MIVRNVQMALIKAIIEVNAFYTTNRNYLLDYKIEDNNYSKILYHAINEIYDNFSYVPTYAQLKEYIQTEIISSPTQQKVLDDHVNTIMEWDAVNRDELNFVVANIKKIVQKNLFTQVKRQVDSHIEPSELHSTYSLIEKCIEYEFDTDGDDMGFSDYGKEEKKETISSGLSIIDGGNIKGYDKGSVSLYLAASGVGKSTILSKVAIDSYLYNNSTYHIIFEDKKQEIQSKYVSYLQRMSNNTYELPPNYETVLDTNFRLKKINDEAFDVDVLISLLKNKIKNGLDIDVLVLDYLDSLTLSGGNQYDTWKNDAKILLKLINFAEKYNIAIITATQANREALDGSKASATKVGGSIKKIHKTTLAVGISRTLSQTQRGLASMNIEKSRYGAKKSKDDFIWIPEILKIDTSKRIKSKSI